MNVVITINFSRYNLTFANRYKRTKQNLNVLK